MTKTEFLKLYCEDCDFHCSETKCAPYYVCEDDKIEPYISKIVEKILEIERIRNEIPFAEISVSIANWGSDIYMDERAVEALSKETKIAIDDKVMYYSNVRVIGR